MPIFKNNVDAIANDDRFWKDEKVDTNKYINEGKEPKRDFIFPSVLSTCLYHHHHLAAAAANLPFLSHFISFSIFF